MPRKKEIHEELEQAQVVYNAEPTLKRFHASNAFVRGVMGPYGSGKSSACVMEVYRRSMAQEPYHGVRRTRWAVIRNTYPELRDTTVATWKDWISEEICPLNYAPPIHGHMRMPLSDGTIADMEVIFLALDREDDVHKLKSLEVTGAWINEAVEVPKVILDNLRARVGRYPSKRMGGATWSGIIMDTNPPHDEHWYYKLAEEQRPDGYEFFRQPPAILRIAGKKYGDPPEYVPNMGQGQYPAAENVSNHTEGYDYWMKLVPGSDENWIKVFLMAEYGTVMSGRPVYPEYSDTMNCAAENLGPLKGLPLFLGWDFGGTPAVVFAQLTPAGQLRIVDEICSENVGIRWFVDEVVKPHIMNYYQGMRIVSICDPAGNTRQETSELTCLQILEESGIPTEMARTNEFTARREAVSLFLRRMSRDGQSGLLLSPRCRMLRRGFLGGYRYRLMRVSTGERFSAEAEKNEFSHPQDGLQYIALHVETVNASTQPTMQFGSGRPGGSGAAIPPPVSMEAWS
jgi:hypothetical protein